MDQFEFIPRPPKRSKWRRLPKKRVGEFVRRYGIPEKVKDYIGCYPSRDNAAQVLSDGHNRVPADLFYFVQWGGVWEHYENKGYRGYLITKDIPPKLGDWQYFLVFKSEEE